MNLDPSDYLGVVRRQPQPTLAQTERFARFVSSAHSWYKHLPIHPKVPFVFFLDPGAGMSRVQTRTGETALVEISDESKRFHYTWQKTGDYRRRFGYWNYHADYGTSFLYAGEGGVVSTAGAGLRILTQAGDWVGVPPDLANKGTALVSAFVHANPNFDIWERKPDRFGLSALSDPDDARFRPPTHFVLGRLWSALQQDHRGQPDFSEVRRAISQQVLESIEQPGGTKQLASLLQPPWEDGWDWPSESWLEQLRASGVEAGFLSSAVKCVEVELTRRQMASMYRKGTPEPTDWPHEAILAVAEAIMEERGRQLAAMTDAMGRFVGAVFAS